MTSATATRSKYLTPVQPYYHSALYYIDNGFHMISGFLIDYFTGLSNDPKPEKTLEGLKEWGKKTGDIKLVNFSSLRGKHPLYDYYKTLRAITGRKAYYSAAKKLSILSATTKTVKSIEELIKKHFSQEDKKSPDISSIMKNVRNLLTNEQKEKSPSYIKRVFEVFHKYPNSPSTLYGSWLLRLGVIYYFMPFENRFLSTALAATCTYYLTIPPSKIMKDKEGPRLRPAQPEAEPLKESLMEKIASQPSLYEEGLDSFKTDLSNLKFNLSIQDPFYPNEFDLKKDIQKFLDLRDGTTPNSTQWHQYHLKMLSAGAEYVTIKLPKELKTEEVKRKDAWTKWHELAPDDAVKYLKEDLKLSEDQIKQNWQPAYKEPKPKKKKQLLD